MRSIQDIILENDILEASKFTVRVKKGGKLGNLLKYTILKNGKKVTAGEESNSRMLVGKLRDRLLGEGLSPDKIEAVMKTVKIPK